MAVFWQEDFQVRFDWGVDGAANLAPHVDVLVVVDVLSFTTAVDVAVAAGAVILPRRVSDPAAGEFAAAHSAVLAVRRPDVTEGNPYSLSPATYLPIPEGTRVVLVSPNGGAVTLAATGCTVLAGCLRNATAVAQAALSLGETVGVVAAGERWPGGGLRPAFEDLIGAGAVIDGLRLAGLSPEAETARAAYRTARDELSYLMADCASARELAAAGYELDVSMAAELDCSMTVPVFDGTAFTRLRD